MQRKLKGFTKLLKTKYLCTYEHDHQLKDIISPLEKQSSTTNKSKPDIYQSLGEVSDGGWGRIKFSAQAQIPLLLSREAILVVI